MPYRSVYRCKVSFSFTWFRFVKIIKELRNAYHFEIPLLLTGDLATKGHVKRLISFLCVVSLTDKDRGRELR